MATEFVMPKLGLTMEEGTIVEWLVPDGAEVDKGQPVLRIQTDKVDSDVESAGSGKLHFTGEVGDTFECGAVIGYFLDDGEELPTPPTAAPAPAAAAAPSAAAPAAAAAAPVRATRTADGRLLASPNARRVAADLGVPLAAVGGTGPGGRIVSEDVIAAHEAGVTAVPARAVGPAGIDVPATFAGRQLADLLGVDIATVPADAVDGRVTRDAVAHHVRSLLAGSTGDRGSATPPTPAEKPKAALAPATQTPTEVLKFKGMRGTIASRMHESLQSMAQLTLFMDTPFDAVVADRSARKADGSAPGFTDYVIAASARALRDHPIVNSQVTDDGIALLPDVHVGMAVALDGGLVVPVIRDTVGRDLLGLAEETARLAKAARSGGLKLDELEGGTFSVSTLGMYGVDGFTPVINPPNTAILGVGRLRQELSLTDGEVTESTVVTLSLTWDHRVFDGAPAAEFCRSIVEHLQDPAGLDTTSR